MATRRNLRQTEKASAAPTGRTGAPRRQAGAGKAAPQTEEGEGKVAQIGCGQLQVFDSEDMNLSFQGPRRLWKNWSLFWN